MFLGNAVVLYLSRPNIEACVYYQSKEHSTGDPEQTNPKKIPRYNNSITKVRLVSEL